jgi:hypothetical protein
MSLSILISYLSTINLFFPIKNMFEKQQANINNHYLFSPSLLLPSSSSNSEIKDPKGDVKPIQIYRTNIIPKIKDYYDIVLASVKKLNGKLVFSMELSGDPNKNGKYETSYIWLLHYSNTISKSSDRNNNKEQIYSLIIPNFAPDSNFKLKGWYMAIYNNTDGSYILPLAKISDMPKNTVQVHVDPILIGNPSSFNYITSVMVRVNSTFLNKPPDYIMDSAPDNDRFWREWFTQ